MTTKHIDEIKIPNAPPIPWLTFRHYRGAEDHALMADLVNTANQADGVPEVSSEETMAHYYSDPKNLDPYKDVLITEVNGQPACYSRVFWLDQDANLEGKARIYRSVTFMRPAWRRKGLGRASQAYNERRIREIAAGDPPNQAKYLEVTIPEAQLEAAVLLKQFGYRPTRHFFIMSRDLSGEIPAASMPSGARN
ncbi:MAG: hypothetical protein M1347_08610 [Chloroflexi bacterium]|nr:hypothetical protein [Chloroflexota bacterium]